MIVYNSNWYRNQNNYLTYSIVDALRTMLAPEEVVLASCSDLLRLAASGNHSDLLCLDGQLLDAGLIERARPALRFCCIWFFEDPYEITRNIARADAFDLVFTNDPGSVEMYGKKGRYLALAASDTTGHRPLRRDEDLVNDVFFAGTMWPNRVAPLQHLITKRPDLKYKLVCPINEHLPPLPQSLVGRTLTRQISHTSFVEFANQSRLTITLFREFTGGAGRAKGESPGPRLYELAMAGTAQLVESGGEAFDEIVREVAGVRIFKNHDELLAGVDELLQNPSSRADRAYISQRSAMSRHRYQDRLAAIFDARDEFLRTASPPASDDARQKRHVVRVLVCTQLASSVASWDGLGLDHKALSDSSDESIEFLYWIRAPAEALLIDGNRSIIGRYKHPPRDYNFELDCIEEETAFSTAISRHGIDIVHLRHLRGYPVSLIAVARAAGAGVVLSIEDFFLVCTRPGLIDYRGIFCKIHARSVSACDICLRNSENVNVGAQERRRLFIETMLSYVDIFSVGTKYSIEVMRGVYPSIPLSKFRVISRLPPSINQSMSESTVKPVADKLRVAFIGRFNRLSGADTFINLLKYAPLDEFSFSIYGDIDSEYRTIIDELQHLLEFLGPLIAGELPFAGTDVTLHLSIWPETFCIALSEAWQVGAIPIVAEVGALSDRVTNEVDGLVVPIDSAAEVYHALERLRTDHGLRRSMMKRIDGYRHQTAAEHFAVLRDIYFDASSKNRLESAAIALPLDRLDILRIGAWRADESGRNVLQEYTVEEVDLAAVPASAAMSHERVHCFLDRWTARSDQEQVYIRADGWSFLGGGRRGSVFLCLCDARSKSVILLPMQSSSRHDVKTVFPDAPSRCGFFMNAVLQASELQGAFRLLLVHVIGHTFYVGDLCSNFSTNPKIEFCRGETGGDEKTRLSYASIIYAFLRFPKVFDTELFSKADLPPMQCLYHLDELEVDSTSSNLALRGWMQLKDGQDVEHYWFAVLQPDIGPIAMYALRSVARPDVVAIHSGTPEMCGFSGILPLAEIPEGGGYRLALMASGARGGEGGVLPVTLERDAGGRIRFHVETKRKRTMRELFRLV